MTPVNYEPVHKRPYEIFLSHSSTDKKTTVNALYYWLNDIANIRVWYDSADLPKGVQFIPALAQSITQCRSMVIVLSKASIESAWVEQEYNYALNHMAHFRDFKIIPIVVDDVDVPGFLQNQNYIMMPDGQITLDFCDQLLGAIYPGNVTLDPSRSQDIYISRTWRAAESEIADAICKELAEANFRLIGDRQDHPSFTNERLRVESIVTSCGGMVAILPYRSNSDTTGYTSEFMLEEVYIAMRSQLPTVIFAEEGVELADDIAGFASNLVINIGRPLAPDALSRGIDYMREHWKSPQKPHQVFFAGSFETAIRNHVVQKTIQRITGMQCILGDNIRDANKSVQQAITARISDSSLMIADITGTKRPTDSDEFEVKDPINTFIELGIARGLNITYYMITNEPERRAPFMFRDSQLFRYQDESELIGLIHSLVYPYRRRILNYEIEH